jgi:LCP family protein required for cell wall assembly
MLPQQPVYPPRQPPYPQQPGAQRPVYRPMAPRPGQPPRRIPVAPRRRRLWGPGCAPLLLVGLFVLALGLVYLLFPTRTTLLLIGVDYAEDGSATGRSDTLMIAQVEPLQPRIALLSIPRDLWVTIPGYGENRINTAHFFAESTQPGSGPAAVRQTVRQNFGVDAPYYVRVKFGGFVGVVEAMGGVDITLTEPAAGYEPGTYHLKGRKALSFVRARYGSDDFHRMGNGQLMLRAMFKTMLNPLKWWRIPAIIRAGLRAVDTNLPIWEWPRAGFALLRLGPSGIDSRIITREMTSPYVTPEGAQVLLPDWGQIKQLVNSLFR